MNKNDMKCKTEGIIRQLFRDKGISERFGVTECVSGIIESLREEKMPENAANQGRTVKLINDMLSHFNLKIVSIDETPREFELDVDEEAVKEAVNTLADSLKNEGDNTREAAESLREEIKSLGAELERTRTENDRLKSDLNGHMVLIAENMQDIISLAEKGKPIIESINTMLDELEMRAVWDSEGEELAEAAMFSVLKCSNPETRRGKPCIISGGIVIAKGLKFISDEGSV